MKFQLSLLIMTILLTGCTALNCYHCVEGNMITEDRQETRVPGEVKCAEATKVNCDDVQGEAVCLSLKYTAVLIVNGLTKRLKAKGATCSKIKGDDICAIEKGSYVKEGVNVSSFNCTASSCSIDYCNTACVPELSFMIMGTLLCLVTLFVH